MKDRLPIYPGRVVLTPVSGQANTYDMVRADQPTQEGTALNKANLLSDATAAMFGLGVDGVPNDAFSVLGKYNQHWWKRRFNGYKQTVTEAATVSAIEGYYSNEYTFDSQTGKYSLVSPTYYSSLTSSIRGKYFIDILQVPGGGGITAVATGIHYAHPDATIDLKTGRIGPCTRYLSNYVLEEWEYLRSNDRDAYPDSGIVDDYEYVYLGKPLDSTVEPAKIEFLSYVGTGNYGDAGYACSLTCDFAPKAILYLGCVYGGHFYAVGRTAYNGLWIVVPETLPVYPKFVSSNGFTDETGYNNLNYAFGNVSEDGKTVRWYNTNSAQYQLNTSGYKYYFLALG